jgi:TnpA family transposase
MMSLETSRRVWQAREDPRRQTASIGIYSHVKDRWGIFHAQPIVLNERQAGAAIEGVVRHERVETTQLAVDTHGYTDFAMALARLLGFDLCPRLRELKQQHLFVPRGTKVPEELAAVCEAGIDTALIEGHWDTLVHLAASVSSGHSSAVTALARFGSGRPEEVTRSTTPACSWASCCARRSWLTTSSTPASAGSCVACSTAARRSTR